MILRLLSSVLLVVLALGARGASGQETFLFSSRLNSASAADQQVMDRVKARAAQMKWKGVEIFEKQSFRLTRNGKQVAVFVTGRVTAPTDPDSLACFVTMVEPQDVPEMLLTIGDGSTRERCGTVRATGLLTVPSSTARVHIGVVFDDSTQLDTPQSFLDVIDPMVFMWDGATYHLAVDEESTRRVVEAQAENLPALQRALR